MTTPTVEERDQLRGTVRGFLAEYSREADVRRVMVSETGYDVGVWRLMVGQLGLTALGLPEAYGGVGTLVEAGVVCEEAGRVLLCAPYLAGLTAGQALVAAGDAEACADLVPGIADGSTVATLAVAEAGGRWRTGGRYATTARPGGPGGRWLLSGAKWFVVDGMAADLLLVAAETRDGAALFVVEGDAVGVTRRPLACLDLTRRQARVDFADTPARPIVAVRPDPVGAALDRAAALLAAEQLGGIRRVLDGTVEYARTRVQFGRPIGSFQAVKHRLADLLVVAESAHSAAYAALRADPGDGDPALTAALAQAYCADAYVHVAEQAVQLHGGIGFTWEHWAHLYLKRARSTRELFDPPAAHRERMAALLTAPDGELATNA
ncbi:acyl-CoA dehydrogenase family protein [Yinghuangia seranimata]|uniref:acyl-CoA dehydrogenase family protein n=1 Tax=Yinghuangia seranimata TaxID=408067 RepID=UPI00248BD80C|nr:acyl-CoA dehydrogenase family protein [Yinghuangia seranimata]MDI2125345.1 acyl-CoA dehydrogenase family protein [Yinghuangia seranimata]